MLNALTIWSGFLGAALVLACPLLANEPDAESAMPGDASHERDGTELEGDQFGRIGDHNWVRFLSPVSILSHLHVNIEIHLGPESYGDTERPKSNSGDRKKKATKRKQVSKTTHQEARRKIRLLDRDDDGRISLEELKLQLPVKRAVGRFDRWDANEDGFLTAHELAKSPIRRTSFASN